MSNNKKTSVEWLMEQLSKNGTFMINELGEKTKIFTFPNEDIINEANAKHEMDVRLAFNDGKVDVLTQSNQSSEYYYKKKFTNENICNNH